MNIKLRKTTIKNHLSRTRDWFWFMGKKFRTCLTKTWEALEVAIAYLMTALLFVSMPVILFMAILTARNGIVNEGRKRYVTNTETMPVIVYDGVEFHKCVVEGHDYWFVSNGRKNGVVHSESCQCHTNNRIRLYDDRRTKLRMFSFREP